MFVQFQEYDSGRPVAVNPLLVIRLVADGPKEARRTAIACVGNNLMVKGDFDEVFKRLNEAYGPINFDWAALYRRMGEPVDKAERDIEDHFKSLEHPKEG
jgi:hypothetical protein